MKFVDIDKDEDLFTWQKEIEEKLKNLVSEKFGSCYDVVGFEHHIKNDFLEFTFTMAIE